MQRWIEVWINPSKAYLCKLYSGDHYEIEAEGNPTAIKKLVAELNGS